MSSKIKFYIVRHGKTLLNTLDRVQGWCDSPLTPQGIEVAEYLGEGLSDLHFDSVYTSDLRRTRQTAEIILKQKNQTDIEIEEIFGFREACFGAYESDLNPKMWGDASLYLQYTSLAEMQKDVFGGRISNKDVLDVISKLDPMQLAESFDQVEARSQKALLEIAKKEAKSGSDKNILIVAHGMSIICMLSNWGGKDLLKSQLDNASVSEVVYEKGKLTVNSMGDMSYVHKGRDLKTNKL